MDTEGKRIYAIGDIHGCLMELEQVQANIRQDLHMRPHPDPMVVYIGDFMDRGPDSKGVIDNLIGERDGSVETYFLRGNHDLMLLDYLADPKTMATKELHWLNPRLGGDETLRSYHIDPDDDHVHSWFQTIYPQDHHDFLTDLSLYVEIGDYVFVHAGIRPNIPMYKQVEQDIIWIREPFLSHNEDHGFIVIHGHTPVKQVENHGNRIAIDTGAVFGRYLSCLVLEGDDQSLLTAGGIISCPVAKVFK